LEVTQGSSQQPGVSVRTKVRNHGEGHLGERTDIQRGKRLVQCSWGARNEVALYPVTEDDPAETLLCGRGGVGDVSRARASPCFGQRKAVVLESAR